MAELQQCDICKKISPDERGLHIANHWTHVHLDHCSDKPERLFSNTNRFTRVIGGFLTSHHEEALVCEECYSTIRGAFAQAIERAERTGGNS